MELTEKKLNTTAVKAKKQIQITVDEDKNVPDAKMDIERIILAKGNIKLQETEIMVDRIRVIGVLEGEILYSGMSENSRCSVMDFTIHFEEYFHIASVVPTDHVSIVPELEDLNVTLINSRKVGIRAILNFLVTVMDEKEVNVISHAEGDGIQELHKNLTMTQLSVNKKDIVRLKEEVQLPANKPNIYEPLWSYVEIQKVESRVYDQKIEIQGQLVLFLLYLGEDEAMPLQFAEWELPVNAQLECSECREGMVANIGYHIVSRNLEIKPDVDGETRIIQAEIALEMDLKIYKEESIDLLEDVYHWKKELIPENMEFLYQQLVAKNSAVMKLNQRISLGKRQNEILQILYIDGRCKIDESKTVSDGVEVEGVIDCEVLYLTADDNTPVGSMAVIIPFTYTIEAKGIKESDHYQIHTALDRLNATFSGGDEMEVKAEVTFDMLVLTPKTAKAIARIEERELDLKRLQQMPGIVGYIVRPGDSLWKIAKKYYTTMDSIRKLNENITEDLKPGTRLIVMKEIEESLG
jgi:hypothetical protein